MFDFIGSRIRQLWRKFSDKGYRDAFVSSHVSSNIANQVSTLRESKGWTQQQLADAAGMKQSRISVLEDPENTSATLETLKRIASAFDLALAVRFVPYSDIVRWSVDPSESEICPRSFKDDSLGGAPVTHIEQVSAWEKAWHVYQKGPEEIANSEFATARDCSVTLKSQTASHAIN